MFFFTLQPECVHSSCQCAFTPGMRKTKTTCFLLTYFLKLPLCFEYFSSFVQTPLDILFVSPIRDEEKKTPVRMDWNICCLFACSSSLSVCSTSLLVSFLSYLYLSSVYLSNSRNVFYHLVRGSFLTYCTWILCPLAMRKHKLIQDISQTQVDAKIGTVTFVLHR